MQPAGDSIAYQLEGLKIQIQHAHSVAAKQVAYDFLEKILATLVSDLTREDLKALQDLQVVLKNFKAPETLCEKISKLASSVNVSPSTPVVTETIQLREANPNFAVDPIVRELNGFLSKDQVYAAAYLLEVPENVADKWKKDHIIHLIEYLYKNYRLNALSAVFDASSMKEVRVVELAKQIAAKYQPESHCEFNEGRDKIHKFALSLSAEFFDKMRFGIRYNEKRPLPKILVKFLSIIEQTGVKQFQKDILEDEFYSLSEQLRTQYTKIKKELKKPHVVPDPSDIESQKTYGTEFSDSYDILSFIGLFIESEVQLAAYMLDVPEDRVAKWDDNHMGHLLDYLYQNKKLGTILTVLTFFLNRKGYDEALELVTKYQPRSMDHDLSDEKWRLWHISHLLDEDKIERMHRVIPCKDHNRPIPGNLGSLLVAINNDPLQFRQNFLNNPEMQLTNIIVPFDELYPPQT